jgi:hypothetical protein
MSGVHFDQVQDCGVPSELESGKTQKPQKFFAFASSSCFSSLHPFFLSPFALFLLYYVGFGLSLPYCASRRFAPKTFTITIMEKEK